MRWVILIIASAILGAVLPISEENGNAADFTIYSVYQRLNLGNPGETTAKDYYINMGTKQGVHIGSTLLVLRKVSSYDLTSEQLYRDVTFPIAYVKVIHAESWASIVRLDKLLPEEQTPAISPRAIMVGDIIKIPDSNP